MTDPDVRALLRVVLELSTEFACYEASDGHAAFDVGRERRPKLIVLDHAMPGLTGLDVALSILELDPAQLVIPYPACLDPRVIASAEEAGVRVPRKDQFRALVSAIAAADQAPS